MDRQTVLDIERRTLSLLETHGLLRVPVDVVTLAQKLHIGVYKASFGVEGISGAIQKSAHNIGKIWVNRFEGDERQRFTIAHEIGHWVLHMQAGDALSEPKHLVEWRLSGGNVSEKEQEADRFASALLMPASLVASARERLGPDASHLGTLFGVSPSSMGIRLQDVAEL